VVAGGGRSALSSSSSRTGFDPNSSSSLASGRTRGGRPVTGEATPRPPASGDLIGFPFWGPWGDWYPWYSGGFGWGVGFYGYSPWLYAGTCWGWGHYGAWYDPYGYCFDSYWIDPGYGYSGGGPSEPKYQATTGTIRLRVDPSTAKVYIDNALAGTVAEFNGLTDHLEIEGGHHELKLVADGFQIYTGDINVEIGRTKTVRVNLKKK
jgi:hypothetical protein